MSKVTKNDGVDLKGIANVLQLRYDTAVMEGTMKTKIPQYASIREYLQEKIDQQVWKEGELIPTEAELMKLFSVSRVTIRKAIDLLVSAHYLTPKAGYGTTVNPDRSLLSNFTLIQSFTNEMKEMGLATKTMHATVEKVEANDLLASIFKINPGDMVYHIVRTRGTTVPLIYSDTYLLPVIDIPLDSEEMYGSLYAFLAKHQIYFSYFEEFVSAVQAKQEVKLLLQVDAITPQLKRKRFSYDVTGKLIEYTETFYNAQQYEYRTKIFYKK